MQYNIINNNIQIIFTNNIQNSPKKNPKKKRVPEKSIHISIIFFQCVDVQEILKCCSAPTNHTVNVLHITPFMPLLTKLYGPPSNIAYGTIAFEVAEWEDIVTAGLSNLPMWAADV